ncbi:hypothetical protein JYU34_012841 [Plutella xylostella]|uniref:RAD50-interacting protein 1 n=1 Tax=Plutella xylostella TaxID=51655 RepID=A0ABQ7QFX2_PLUXY|nr:hypothetical protein JYU34_012841 [Plutella xylostella]
MNDEEKSAIQEDLNIRIGNDILNPTAVYDIENELILKRDHLQRCLHIANDEVPSKLSSAIEKAQKNCKQIERLKDKQEKLQAKVDQFLNHTGPLRNELNDRLTAISKLEGVLQYLNSFDKIEELSSQLKQCSDDEQAVLLYADLKEMCIKFMKGHRSAYVKEYTHYWHNVLKDKLSKQYEEVLKLLKWPFTTVQEPSPPPKEVMAKFANITRQLFLIEEPKDNLTTSVTCDFSQDVDPCLPVKMLLRPLKKRFAFHFTGNRQTARIDRPEWFLTQTLTWIKDHQAFISKNVQPVADKMNLRNVNTKDEFNAGLVALAAERLHTVLGLYYTHSGKGDMIDVDAAFAHAVDETLGFHKELVALTEKDINSVLSVLTKAETFERWLAVEKKYALAKMDETLGSSEWRSVVCAGGGAAGWVPRAADWFIALLTTIEERYAVLPRPGHRLQFLELQLELIDEWRVRLTQLLRAATEVLDETFLTSPDSMDPMIAVINAAHHTRTVLLQRAHSLHYLQLHYYRRQFQQLTRRQHCDENDLSYGDDDEDLPMLDDDQPFEEVLAIPPSLQMHYYHCQTQQETWNDEVVEKQDHQGHEHLMPDVAGLHLHDNAEGRRPRPTSLSLNTNDLQALEPRTHRNRRRVSVDSLPIQSDGAEAGVFGEAPALLARLRDAGAATAARHMLAEFRHLLGDYRKQRWHAMSLVEEMAMSISPSLCRPLGALCARLHSACSKLAPFLCARLRAFVTSTVDTLIFEEVVLESWWNTGGTMQLTHDVKRNLVPAFARPDHADKESLFPKLVESCTLLNLDYDDARRLRAAIASPTPNTHDSIVNGLKITHIQPLLCLRILSQRTDLSDNSPPSVLELF